MPSAEADGIPDADEPFLEMHPPDDFFRACGGRGPIRLDIGPDDASPDCRHFEQPFLLIGRSAECDVQLLHSDVSFRHAYMQMIAGELLCFDLDSRAGVHWHDGAKVSDWLRIGQSIGVGPFSIHLAGDDFADRPDSDELLAIHGSYDHPIPDVYLEFLNAHRMSKNGRHCRLTRSVTLMGKGSHCKIRLRGDGVSRMHCSLVLTQDGLWVVDLLGRHGTYVNERRVPYSRLEDGDEIRIGSYRLGIRYGQANDQNEATERSEKSPMQGRTRRTRKKHASIRDSRKSAPRRKPKRSMTAADKADTGLAPSGQPATPAGFSESFVLALIEQFSAMQRTLFQQSQQQTWMLTQMLGAMHQSQRELIEEDLARVNSITSELQQLQMKLLEQPAGSRPGQQAPFADSAAAADADAVDAEFAPSTQPGDSTSEEFTADDAEANTGEPAAAVQEHTEHADDDAAEDESAVGTDGDREHAAAPDRDADERTPHGTSSKSADFLQPAETPPSEVDASQEAHRPAAQPPDSSIPKPERSQTTQSSQNSDLSDWTSLEDDPVHAVSLADDDSSILSVDQFAADDGEPAATSPGADESGAELPDRPPRRRDPAAVETHAWLAERMAALESERTSRLQKIMQVLTGSGSR